MRIFLTKFPHVSAYIALVSATIRHSFAGKACLLIGITAVLYGLLINNLNLWTDEIYSVLMAKDSLGDMGSPFRLIYSAACGTAFCRNGSTKRLRRQDGSMAGCSDAADASIAVAGI